MPVCQRSAITLQRCAVGLLRSATGTKNDESNTELMAEGKTIKTWEAENVGGVLDDMLSKALEETPKSASETWGAWALRSAEPMLQAYVGRTLQAAAERLNKASKQPKPAVDPSEFFFSERAPRTKRFFFFSNVLCGTVAPRLNRNADAAPRVPLTAVVVNNSAHLKRSASAIAGGLADAATANAEKKPLHFPPPYAGGMGVGRSVESQFLTPHRGFTLKAPSGVLATPVPVIDLQDDDEERRVGLSWNRGDATFGGVRDFVCSNQNKAFIAHFVAPENAMVNATLSKQADAIDISVTLPWMFTDDLNLPSHMSEQLKLALSTTVGDGVCEQIAGVSAKATLTLAGEINPDSFLVWKAHTETANGFKVILFSGFYKEHLTTMRTITL